LPKFSLEEALMLPKPAWMVLDGVHVLRDTKREEPNLNKATRITENNPRIEVEQGLTNIGFCKLLLPNCTNEMRQMH
jgi:hypothetical protein